VYFRHVNCGSLKKAFNHSDQKAGPIFFFITSPLPAIEHSDPEVARDGSLAEHVRPEWGSTTPPPSIGLTIQCAFLHEIGNGRLKRTHENPKIRIVHAKIVAWL